MAAIMFRQEDEASNPGAAPTHYVPDGEVAARIADGWVIVMRVPEREEMQLQLQVVQGSHDDGRHRPTMTQEALEVIDPPAPVTTKRRPRRAPKKSVGPEDN
jgi:hypothetical protein